MSKTLWKIPASGKALRYTRTLQVSPLKARLGMKHNKRCSRPETAHNGRNAHIFCSESPAKKKKSELNCYACSKKKHSPASCAGIYHCNSHSACLTLFHLYKSNILPAVTLIRTTSKVCLKIWTLRTTLLLASFSWHLPWSLEPQGFDHLCSFRLFPQSKVPYTLISCQDLAGRQPPQKERHLQRDSSEQKKNVREE